MSSKKTKQAWEPREASVKAADREWYLPNPATIENVSDHEKFMADRKYVMRGCIKKAVAADPLLSAAKDMQDALDALEQAFIAHTQWNGALPAEVIAARAALAKSRGGC